MEILKQSTVTLALAVIACAVANALADVLAIITTLMPMLTATLATVPTIVVTTNVTNVLITMDSITMVGDLAQDQISKLMAEGAIREAVKVQVPLEEEEAELSVLMPKNGLSLNVVI